MNVYQSKVQIYNGFFTTLNHDYIFQLFLCPILSALVDFIEFKIFFCRTKNTIKKRRYITFSFSGLQLGDR